MEAHGFADHLAALRGKNAASAFLRAAIERLDREKPEDIVEKPQEESKAVSSLPFEVLETVLMSLTPTPKTCRGRDTSETMDMVRAATVDVPATNVTV